LVRQYQGVGRKQTIPVLLSDLEVQRLTASAERVGVNLALYLRAAALNAAAETVSDHRPTYSREQLMSIHRQAQNLEQCDVIQPFLLRLEGHGGCSGTPRVTWTSPPPVLAVRPAGTGSSNSARTGAIHP